MASVYVKGEKKIRPGIYNRYENRTVTDNTGAIDGICAVPIHATSGPLEEVRLFTTSTQDDFTTMYGEGGTTDAVREMFKGGALQVYTYRLGTGGAKATATLSDTEGTEVLGVTALYPGTQPIYVTIRERLTNANQKELLVTGGATGTQILEQFVFDAKAKSDAVVGDALTGEVVAGGSEETAGVENEVDALIKTFTETGSNYIAIEKKADGIGELELVSSVQLSGGEDPVVTASDYSNAFNAFEPYRFNIIAADTLDDNVRALLTAYVDRIFNEGRWTMAVVGNGIDVGFSTRCARASSTNDALCMYVGGQFNDSTGLVEGYRCIDRIAGMAAAVPANESLVHRTIPGAVSLAENLTNSQYETAYTSGMVAISQAADGTVWLDNAVTTLVSPGADQDDGWKKVKRVKTRLELMDRIDRRLAPMIGQVNCTSDGISLVVQAAQDICNTMVQEGKLLDGATVLEDPDNPATTDSLWLLVQVDDPDTLEKIYLNYQFRFSPDTVTTTA